MSSRGSDQHLLHPDRLFPADPTTRAIARDLYRSIVNEPIVSPHGHTDPAWFATNEAFEDPASLLITPDHYVLRMLYSQGIRLEDLGVSSVEGSIRAQDPRKIWHQFASQFHLFRGTPTDLWMRHVFHEVFGLDQPLTPETADLYYDFMHDQLRSAQYRPRALFERFKIEVVATTDAATDDLEHHSRIRKDWSGRVIPTYRPDASVDPEHGNFQWSLDELSRLTNEDARSWSGYINAHLKRRQFFKMMGATATDHGHPTPQTLNLSETEATELFKKVQAKTVSVADAERFRALMLFKMAEMSVTDGLAMQVHPGSFRNHNAKIYKTFGRDKGADIPVATEFTKNLKPLLDAFGNDSRLSLIVFTLDESCYARELAPLAGHYPAMKLGAPWWFHDSPEGMLRFRKQTTETAGFQNTTGFVDDTRAFFSIPARHDVARRIDCRFLAELVAEHRLSEHDAFTAIKELTATLAKKAYRL